MSAGEIGHEAEPTQGLGENAAAMARLTEQAPQPETETVGTYYGELAGEVRDARLKAALTSMARRRENLGRMWPAPDGQPDAEASEQNARDIMGEVVADADAWLQRSKPGDFRKVLEVVRGDPFHEAVEMQMRGLFDPRNTEQAGENESVSETSMPGVGLREQRFRLAGNIVSKYQLINTGAER